MIKINEFVFLEFVLIMQIGFVNFSQEELDKKNKVLQLLREQRAIDELGLGRIRDAFANLMFPGTSTLHRRAKYFAVMPSLFYLATKKKYETKAEVRKQIIRWEINLTEKLLKRAIESDKNGVTGRSVISEAKKDPNKFVKYDPAYIYINGLRTFEMVNVDSDIYSFIFDESKKNEPQKFESDTEGQMSDSLDLSGKIQMISTCGEIYDFDTDKPILLSLTENEAEYIKTQITRAKGSKDSFLAYLLNNKDIAITQNYVDLGFDNIDPKFKEQYEMGKVFSYLSYVIHLRFNYIMANFINSTDECNKIIGEIDEFIENNKKYFKQDVVNEMLDFIGDKVTEKSVICFCKEAIELIVNKNWSALDEKIKEREKRVKGNRYKLENEKYKGEKRDKPYMYSFRWNDFVYQLIKEIREATK